MLFLPYMSCMKNRLRELLMIESNYKATYDIDQYYKSKASTLHPESENVLEVRQYAKDKSKHRSYLVFERRSLRLIVSSFCIPWDLNPINCICSVHEYLLHKLHFHFFHIISTLNYKPITFVSNWIRNLSYVKRRTIIISYVWSSLISSREQWFFIAMIIMLSILLYHDHHHYIQRVVWIPG